VLQALSGMGLCIVLQALSGMGLCNVLQALSGMGVLQSASHMHASLLHLCCIFVA